MHIGEGCPRENGVKRADTGETWAWILILSYPSCVPEIHD